MPTFDETYRLLAAFPQLQAIFALVVTVVSLWMIVSGRRAARNDPRPPAAFPSEGSPIIFTGPINAALEQMRDNGETLRSIEKTLTRIENILLIGRSTRSSSRPRARSPVPPPSQ